MRSLNFSTGLSAYNQVASASEQIGEVKIALSWPFKSFRTSEISALEGDKLKLMCTADELDEKMQERQDIDFPFSKSELDGVSMN